MKKSDCDFNPIINSHFSGGGVLTDHEPTKMVIYPVPYSANEMKF